MLGQTSAKVVSLFFSFQFVLRFGFERCLSKISTNFIEKMMTKYSYFEHSQPSEKSIELPDLEYLEKDVTDLIDWGKDYKKRLNKK